ncbi:MAG: acyl-CoA thioesterase [Maricaulaceae bacterium]
MFSRQDLLDSMNVEEIDTLLYSGQPLKMDLPRVFGGQVLGQVLNAAVRTVDPEKRPHSLHGYFLRPGDITRPIIYEVDPIRDGRSFSTRRVVGKQKGEAIFNASISFQKLEEGLDHQMDMPEGIPMPDDIPPDFTHAQEIIKDIPGLEFDRFRTMYLVFEPDVVDMRTPDLERVLHPGKHDPDFGYWFKFDKAIGDDPITHRTLLAFMSDKALMSTSLYPHDISFVTHKIIGASLDHAMWFHDKIRVDQWIYYHLESPRAARNRGLNRGSFYTQDGRLIASTIQEGLMRVVEKKIHKSI